MGDHLRGPFSLDDDVEETEIPFFGERRDGLDALGEVLRKNKFLKFLDVSSNGIHGGGDRLPEEEEEIIDIVADMKETLQNKNNNNNNQNLKELAEKWDGLPLWQLTSPLLKHNQTLRVLNLSNNILKAEGTQMLSVALSTNAVLEVLDLSNNQIPPTGLYYLSKYVLSSPTSALHTLILRKNELAGKKRNNSNNKVNKTALAAAQFFAQSIQYNKNMKRLILSHNHFGAVLSSALLATIDTVEKLTELDFSYNEACGEHISSFDPTAIQSIAKMMHNHEKENNNNHQNNENIKKVPTLRRLHLAGNNIHNKGLQLLLPSGFSLITTLEVVDLSRNNIDNDGLEFISSLLLQSYVIRQLDLSFNGIESGKKLLPGLCQNTSLQGLDLSHNVLGGHPVDDEVNNNQNTNNKKQLESFAELLSAILANPNLTSLNLSYNDLTVSHFHYLSTILRQDEMGRALTQLDVSYNPKVNLIDTRKFLLELGGRPGLTSLSLSLPSAYENNENNNNNHKSILEAQLEMLRDVRTVVEESKSLVSVEAGIRVWDAKHNEDPMYHEFVTLMEQIKKKLMYNAFLKE
ncbi:Leucine Rich repeat, putative [Angomonas deanei]|uniref:Leucine Rich repeat, putative n=1 Tax=Angomonas deanei TaxID=59799 RepID=A0A7G2CWX8_9TRYP|nr:Leucine Rich repeat, putative [Angomonas deanei]